MEKLDIAQNLELINLPGLVGTQILEIFGKIKIRRMKMSSLYKNNPYIYTNDIQRLLKKKFA